MSRKPSSDRPGTLGADSADSAVIPVLVVSSDAINRLPLVVTVVVGTDAANIARDYPVNVRVTAAESGLPRDTVFLCFQAQALDPSRLVTPEAGALPPLRMAEVDTALRRTLDL